MSRDGAIRTTLLAKITRRIHLFLHAQPISISMMVLISSVAVFSFIIPEFRFLHPFNLSLILQQVSLIGILGVAQTLVILTAGIDLSVGAIMVLSSIVMGRMAMVYGLPDWVALLVGLGIGALAGAINGLLVSRIKLPPFIVTLGTWSIFFALNLWYSGSETHRSQDVAEVAPLLQFLGTPLEFAGARFTYGSIAMVLLFFVFWYVLKLTPWGRHVYATGDDPEAAELVGINTSRVLLSVYTTAGVICAFAGWALIGRIGSISPQAGQTGNLDSITAVVIGGVSLFGGRGAIIGTLLGALVVGVFRNGLAIFGIDVLWQEFTVGILVILAVAIDQWARKIVA